jgi:ribosome-binding protein aMBF1 (putative translation factor)
MASHCALCGNEVETGKGISVKASCHHCGGDLHICLNCSFYSKTSHNNCTEPRSEKQRSRDKGNFCDWFRFKEGLSQDGSASSDSRDDVKKKFDDLFRKQ